MKKTYYFCVLLFLGTSLFANFSFLDMKDPLLNQKSEKVSIDEINSPEIQEIIDSMLEIAKGERQDETGSIMVGLAAPQIGILKRIILVDLKTQEDHKDISSDLQVFINPEIICQTKDLRGGREGCYSTGNIHGIVYRASIIKVRAYNRKGEVIEQTFKDLTARIFQHEIDHLEGIRFPDRVFSDQDLHIVEEFEYKEYSENYQNWDKIFPIEEWKKIKGSG